MQELVRLVFSLSLSGGLIALVVFALKPLIRNRLLVSIMQYKPKNRMVLGLSIVLLLALSCCALAFGSGAAAEAGAPDSQTTETETEILYTYDWSALLSCASPDVSHADVNRIVYLLPVPNKHFRVQSILQEEDAPYSLTIVYVLSEDDGSGWGDAPNHSVNIMCDKNALLLFSLIDNLDEVRFEFAYPNGHLVDTFGLYTAGYTLYRLAFDKLGDLQALWAGSRTALLDALDALEASPERHRSGFTVQIPAGLSRYRYTEEGPICFGLWEQAEQIGGLEILAEDRGLHYLNHATLLSEEELTGFSGHTNFSVPDKVVRRLYERDYPAASGRTDTYRQSRIGLLYYGNWYDFWLDLRYGTEEELLALVESVRFAVRSVAPELFSPSNSGEIIPVSYIDAFTLELLETTGNWDSMAHFLPYMSADNMEKIAAIARQWYEPNVSKYKDHIGLFCHSLTIGKN